MHKIFLILLCFAFHLQLVQTRYYFHTSSELKLTNRIAIPQTNCARNETPIFVHTAAVTSGKYYQRRMTIRATWGREAAEHGLKVIFVIGYPEKAEFEPALKAEAAEYGDLLQIDFIENYYNLTLKAIAELKWASRHCNQSSYLLKVDDDVLVNVPMLASVIANGGVRSGFTGRFMTTPANRQVGHKWYMPPRYFKKGSYKFLAGFSYLLSTNRLKKLLDSIKTYKGRVLDIDDLWLTGIIADYGRIKKHNSELFRFYCGLDACLMENSLVMHACGDSRETEVMYNVWKGADVRHCSRWTTAAAAPEVGGSKAAGNNSELFQFNLASKRFVIKKKS